jgi:hypothetical protein
MMLKSGDWIEIRSKEEILATLDSQGKLGGLPFMPEMFQHCGKRFRIYKRAHKTCDTITGTGGRRLSEGIHLDLRCDGKAHGNCQAACLLFWKEAWLKPTGVAAEEPTLAVSSGAGSGPCVGCSEQQVDDGTSYQHLGSIRYTCQATELLNYTSRLPWWNLFQYLEDYRSGNVTMGRLLRGMVYACFNQFPYRLRKLAPLFHWLYDSAQKILGGVPYPRRMGTIPIGQPTPGSTLNLQPGDLVRAKPYKDILATLDRANKNAGLFFDAELVPYCGGTYRVRARVHQFIDEATGKMSFLKTPAVILENVWCQSRYSACRMLCPRSIYSWWREVWLERVPEDSLVFTSVESPASCGPDKQRKPAGAGALSLPAGFASGVAIGNRANGDLAAPGRSSV